MDNLVSVGYIQKAHGLKGAVKIYVEPKYEADIKTAQVLFVDEKGHHLPYFVENIQGNQPLIIKFEEVDTPEAASDLRKKNLLMRSEDIKTASVYEELSALTYEPFVGYLIQQTLDEEIIGTLEAVEAYPQQEMGVVNQSGNSVLIPLNEHFIQKIDKERQIIFVDLPEGLLNL